MIELFERYSTLRNIKKIIKYKKFAKINVYTVNINIELK